MTHKKKNGLKAFHDNNKDEEYSLSFNFSSPKPFKQSPPSDIIITILFVWIKEGAAQGKYTIQRTFLK